MAANLRQFSVKCRQCGKLGTHVNGPRCLICGALLPPPGVTNPPMMTQAPAPAPPSPKASRQAGPLPPWPESAPTGDDSDASGAFLLDQPTTPQPAQPPPVVLITPSRPHAHEEQDTSNRASGPHPAARVTPPPAESSPQYDLDEEDEIWAPPQGEAREYWTPPQRARAEDIPPVRNPSPTLPVANGIGWGIALALVIVAGVTAQRALTLGQLGKSTVATSPSVTPITALDPGAWRHIVFQDALSVNQGGWSTTHCKFATDGYHVSPGYACFAPAVAVQDAEITATVVQTAGDSSAGYGLALRKSTASDGYDFTITSAGVWSFTLFTAKGATLLVPPAQSTAMHQGLNQANTLRVRMVGSHFTFYINGTKVGETSDATYASGKVAVFVGTGTGADAVFTNVIIADKG